MTTGAASAQTNTLANHDALFNALSDSVALQEIIYDPAGKAVDYRLLDVNPAFEVAFGFHKADVVGKTATELYGDTGLTNLDVFTRVAETGQSETFDVTYAPELTFRITVYPLAKGQFGTIVRDMRVHVQAEAALKESEARYRSLAENVNDVISEAGIDGKYTYISPASRTMLGYEPEEIVGRTYMDIIHPEDLAATAASAGDGVPALPEVFVNDYRLLHKDGHYVWAEVTTRVVFDEQHMPKTLISTWRDITERRQAEEERTRLQQEVIEAQRNALRELSTPIIPVMEGVIVMPLVGSIDSLRARDVMRTLMTGVSQYRAKVIIIDITGVPLVDSGVADHLNKTIQAARLKGARTILTGMSDAVAETVVDLGINWGDVPTLRDLQTGLLSALSSLGYQLAPTR